MMIKGRNGLNFLFLFRHTVHHWINTSPLSDHITIRQTDQNSVYEHHDCVCQLPEELLDYVGTFSTDKMMQSVSKTPEYD